MQRSHGLLCLESTCKEIRGLRAWDLRACQHHEAEDRKDLGNNVDGGHTVTDGRIQAVMGITL